MKLIKKLLIPAVVMGVIAGGIYMNAPKNQSNTEALTETPIEEVIGENIEAQNESIEEEGALSETKEQEEAHTSDIDKQLEIAQSTFESSGMNNLYPDLRKREKKKWSKLINENNYFEVEHTLNYEISGLYEIAEGQYYILGQATDESEPDTPLNLFQLILEEEDGQYFVNQAIYPSDHIFTPQELELYKKVEQEESNVEIEYKKVRQLEGVEEYVEYLDTAIGDVDEKVLNDHGTSEVTQYVQYALETLSTQSITPEENTIEIKPSLIQEMKGSLTSAVTEFNNLLENKDISLNKALNTILRVETKKTNFKKPIYIKLPDSIEELGEITGLRVLFDKNSYIFVTAKDLYTLAGYTIKIERLSNHSTYEITFLDQSQQKVEQVEAPITIALPAEDELSTVIAHFDETPQNWGGQYDPSGSVIEFGTKYSGQYEVVDNSILINDIGHLTKSQQSAIKFMVAKGYLDIEDGNFNPDADFTRYEFAQALVKMFFALDQSLTTTFKDVPKDSPYYPYVASGETYEIIKGYVDQTFKGDIKIPKEQVISLCARTIADQKGYVYPENVEDYLRFADTENISKWAVDDIALAVQSGLIKDGGELSPKTEITKAQSAEVLYELFMLLYETSPDTGVVEWTSTQKTYSILGTWLLLVLAIWLIRRFIKRNKVIITMIACTAAIIITLIIGFKGGF